MLNRSNVISGQYVFNGGSENNVVTLTEGLNDIYEQIILTSSATMSFVSLLDTPCLVFHTNYTLSNITTYVSSSTVKIKQRDFRGFDSNGNTETKPIITLDENNYDGKGSLDYTSSKPWIILPNNEYEIDYDFDATAPNLKGYLTLYCKKILHTLVIGSITSEI